MKKGYTAIAAIGLMIAALFIAQPASAATGSWAPKGGSFTIPSNWHCGTTTSGPRLSAQTCVVRSGNYVQAATIVRNRASSGTTASVNQVLTENASAGVCAASTIAARSISVCMTPTVYHPALVGAAADVTDIPGFIFAPRS
ncbi:hypothetical protein [Microbacterium sp. NPDC057650]|uniref:hypothetical protein n=1 Tax=unclassified Microbacterium TaxID=2609290 RepID=UPI003671562A